MKILSGFQIACINYETELSVSILFLLSSLILFCPLYLPITTSDSYFGHAKRKGKARSLNEQKKRFGSLKIDLAIHLKIHPPSLTEN